MRIGAWVAPFAVLCVVALPAVAAEEASGTAQDSVAGLTSAAPEIEEFQLIHADSMVLTRQKEKPQVFQGSVDIIMVDKAGQKSRIQAEKMTIYYEQDQKKVQRIEAEGHVRIERADTVATTELAVYRGDKNIMELLVDPHVEDSRGKLSANKITIFIDSDEVVAEGNVRGVVYPEVLEETAGK